MFNDVVQLFVIVFAIVGGFIALRWAVIHWIIEPGQQVSDRVKQRFTVNQTIVIKQFVPYIPADLAVDLTTKAVKAVKVDDESIDYLVNGQKFQVQTKDGEQLAWIFDNAGNYYPAPVENVYKAIHNAPARIEAPKQHKQLSDGSNGSDNTISRKQAQAWINQDKWFGSKKPKFTLPQGYILYQEQDPNDSHDGQWCVIAK